MHDSSERERERESERESESDNEDERTLKAGVLCGAYRIVRLLGRGRTAEVYEAAHIATGRAAALRRLRPELAKDELMRRRLSDETAALHKAKHTNVAMVFEAGVHEGAPFAALEHIAGRSLRERLNAAKGAISMPVALCFARQVADGAGALHAAGVVHGDLRPESVRLTEIDEVKLCDLGPGAPLSLADRGDIPGDIRSVGLMLAEMLAGRAVTASSIAEDLAEIPAYLQNVVESAVSGGFASMAEVVTALNDSWTRLLADERAGNGLREALGALATAIKAMADESRASERHTPAEAAEAAEAAEERDEANLMDLFQKVLDATKDFEGDAR